MRDLRIFRTIRKTISKLPVSPLSNLRFFGSYLKIVSLGGIGGWACVAMSWSKGARNTGIEDFELAARDVTEHMLLMRSDSDRRV